MSIRLNKSISSFEDAENFISTLCLEQHAPHSDGTIHIDKDTFQLLLKSISIFQQKVSDTNNTINKLQNRIKELETSNNKLLSHKTNMNVSCLVCKLEIWKKQKHKYIQLILYHF